MLANKSNRPILFGFFVCYLLRSSLSCSTQRKWNCPTICRSPQNQRCQPRNYWAHYCRMEICVRSFANSDEIESSESSTFNWYKFFPKSQILGAMQRNMWVGNLIEYWNNDGWTFYCLQLNHIRFLWLQTICYSIYPFQLSDGLRFMNHDINYYRLFCIEFKFKRRASALFLSRLSNCFRIYGSTEPSNSMEWYPTFSRVRALQNG